MIKVTRPFSMQSPLWLWGDGQYRQRTTDPPSLMTVLLDAYISAFYQNQTFKTSELIPVMHGSPTHWLFRQPIKRKLSLTGKKKKSWNNWFQKSRWTEDPTGIRSRLRLKIDECRRVIFHGSCNICSGKKMLIKYKTKMISQQIMSL